MSSHESVLTVPSTAPRERRGLTALILFSLGHFCVDFYSGCIGVFQPLLISKLGLSLTRAGLLGGALLFSSSVMQPFYGYLSDRFRSRLFSALAPVVTGVFISGLGLATGFPMALALILLGGSGIASFHPQGSAWAAAGVTHERGKWMAVFISSGTLGLAIAPAVFERLTAWVGFERVWLAALPGLAVSVLLVAMVRQPAGALSARTGGFDWAALKTVKKPLTILYLGVFFRSVIQVVNSQFLVLYLNRQLGYSMHSAALVLTSYLAAGAFGGFVGGHLSDRFGARRVILWSFAFSAPLMAVFFFLNSGPIGVTALILGSLVLLFTIPVNVVVAQQLVPSQAATVSSLLMGFAWGTSGMIFVPLVGWFSDLTSLHTALSSLLVFPVLGYVLSRYLPEDLGR